MKRRRQTQLRAASAASPTQRSFLGLLVALVTAGSSRASLRPCFSGAHNSRLTTRLHGNAGHDGPLRRLASWTGRRALPGRRVGMRANPMDMFTGAMSNLLGVDTKEELFLLEKIKEFYPDKLKFTAMEVKPENDKMIRYLSQENEDEDDALASKLDYYYTMGDVEDGESFVNAGEVAKVNVVIRTWDPLRPRGDLAGVVDLGVFSRGAITRLRGNVAAALRDLKRALAQDAKIILVVDEADEAAIGGSLESIMQVQDSSEVDELVDLDIEQELVPGKLFRDNGFRVTQVLRDPDSGLALGVLERREFRKKMPKAAAGKAGARRSSSPGSSKASSSRSKASKARGGRGARRAL
eukprot:TRINITY_DN54630_c0_g1_i1.p1 TRINITY_DN54630_c0_g1~~TRINITY_DN54630_c0_g1_i1.p1  ORF type:complete len:353 (-),score=87.58 TRINITY_DN54630_c0_g1_i1:169-1227(-)